MWAFLVPRTYTARTNPLRPPLSASWWMETLLPPAGVVSTHGSSAVLVLLIPPSSAHRLLHTPFAVTPTSTAKSATTVVFWFGLRPSTSVRSVIDFDTT